MEKILEIIKMVAKMFDKKPDMIETPSVPVEPPKVDKPSPKCINLIKQFEGCKLSPYFDSVMVATIGFGSTFYENGIRVTIKDKPISMETAERLLIIKINELSNSIIKLSNRELTQNQLDALVSLVYNIGIGNFKSSTLLKLINDNKYDANEIAGQFDRWNKAGGKVLSGLIRRRSAEKQLWLAN